MGTGQHWTALIVDAEAKEIQYFDSYGMPPTDGILSGSRPYPGIADEQGRFLSLLRNWINDVRLLFVEHGIAMKFVYNTTCHQARRDQSNCGPYSLLFLALRSKGMSFSSITKEVITTKEIEELRGKMYKRVKDYRPVPPLDAL
ncbi:MAG: Ulp1 family isopeptidase [Candidatus Paceibacterota bacterium]